MKKQKNVKYPCVMTIVMEEDLKKEIVAEAKKLDASYGWIMRRILRNYYKKE